MKSSRRSFLSTAAATAASATIHPAGIQSLPVSGQAIYVAERLGWRLSAVRNGVAVFSGDHNDSYTQFVALDCKNDILSLVRRLKDDPDFGWQVKQRAHWAFAPDEFDHVPSEDEVAAVREVFGDAAVDRYLQAEKWVEMARTKRERWLDLGKNAYGSQNELSLYLTEDMTDEQFEGLRAQAAEIAELPTWTEEDAQREFRRESSTRTEDFDEPFFDDEEKGLIVREEFVVVAREILGPDFGFVLIRREFATQRSSEQA